MSMLMPLTRTRNLPRDKHRPTFHFLPERNWMNDPNGLIHWQGQYHLFYQYNPHGPLHGTIHWGHAVSRDLIHWQDLPIALTPTPGGPDEEGCWSGCAVDNDGVPTLVCTGVHPQVVCLATSEGDLTTWKKHPANPVIAAPPEGLGAHTRGQFRDPFVWKEGDSWQLVIGSKIEGEGGLVLRYQSADLIHWEYLGVLLKGDLRQTKPFWTGTVWECPNFFQLGDRRVLLFSAQAEPNDLIYPVYYTGDFHDQQFIPEFQDILVHGNYFYAPQIMHTADGRVVMWGWLKEGRRQTAWIETGWAGVMSVPIELSLFPDGALRLEPVEELKLLRRAHRHFENLEVEPGSVGLLGDLQGDCLEIEAVFKPTDLAEFGLKFCCSPDGAEQTRLVYRSTDERLILEPNESSLSTVVDRDMRKAHLQLDDRGELRLHIFLDHSVLEVFANDRTCLAGRIYPTRADSLGLDLFSRSGQVRLKSLDVWTLDSIWGEE
jgi:beta-fructofuranosidase